MKKAFVARFITVAFIFAALIVAVVFAFSGEKEAPSSGQKGGGRGRPVAVEVARVTVDSVRDTGHFTGSVEARAKFSLAPRIPGRLRRLHVDIGDVVRSGEIVATLDDEEHLQALEQARAELAVAKANVAQSLSALDNARREHSRVRELLARRIASESEMDSAGSLLEVEQARHQVALAQVSQREAAVGAAEVRLSYTRLVAEWDGGGERVVGERFAHEGAMLSANAPVISIVDLDTVLVVIHVAERDYALIRRGHRAAVTNESLPGRSFEGEVLRIAPLLRETSRQARVEVAVDNPGHVLKPGMFARVAMLYDELSNATVVPADALFRRNGSIGVFLVDEDASIVRFVRVVKGIEDGERVQILEPRIGGRVVTLGQHLLEDGSAINIVESGGGEADK